MEEETHFLKTLVRGRRLLQRTLDKLGASATVFPGVWSDQVYAMTRCVECPGVCFDQVCAVIRCVL